MRAICCISCSAVTYRDGRGNPLFCHSCAAEHRSESSRAIGLVSNAIKRGLLQKPSDFDCVDCGAPACEYDHRDYMKPLEVDPVCTRCNKLRGPALNSQMRAVDSSVIWPELIGADGAPDVPAALASKAEA